MTREIDVFLEGHDGPIGRLTGDDHGALSFRYDPDGTRSISLALPREREVFDDAPTRTFFDNLLQENASLDDVMARHGVDRSDIAGLLYHLGRDCPGAISCVPVGEPPGNVPGALDRDYDLLPEDRLAEIMRSLRDRQRLPADTRDPSPLAGVQGKIAVARLADGRFAFPRHNSGVPTTHIIKVPRRGEEALIDQEFSLMQIAREAHGGAVADVEPLDIVDVRGLLIRRFDREVANEVVRRIHQEDFCQAMGLPRRLKYERDGSADRAFTAAGVGTILGRTRLPAVARRDFFTMTILNLALGNTDNHGKNHALLYTGETPELAPLYDVVPVLLDRNVNHDFSFRIGRATRTEQLEPSDLVAFAHDIGIRARGTSAERRLRQDVAKVVTAVTTQISALRGPRLKLLADMLAHQARTLSETFRLNIDVPKRDAFLTGGGGSLLSS